MGPQFQRDDTKAGEQSQAMRTPILKLVCAAILLAGSTVATTTTAGELGGILHNLTTPVRALHRKKPPACQDDVVDRLADEIDWLQAHINSYGSIVAKHPDVWGQNRLTRARYEYEEQLRAKLGTFQELSNASLRRSDQAFLGLALSLSDAPTPTGRGATTTKPADATASVTNLISNPVGGGTPAETVIARTPPFAATAQPFADFGLAKPLDPSEADAGGDGAGIEEFESKRKTRNLDPTAMTGSFLYMSPETLKGERYDARADIFSLGVLLYELFSGVITSTIVSRVFLVLLRPSGVTVFSPLDFFCEPRFFPFSPFFLNLTTFSPSFFLHFLSKCCRWSAPRSRRQPPRSTLAR